MKYSIQINSSPYQSNSGITAYRFITAVLNKGHEVFRVFFYHEGIYHAFKHARPPDDEFAQVLIWSRLAQDNNIDLVVCISAAQRRGLLCADEAKRQGKSDMDIAEGFRIAGLSQLIEAMLTSDRFIIFA
jgi:tRNA 2-thiouridine synthesizing protein D